MAWLVGVDEAGYGPNLGPFVMTSVACRLPGSESEADLWQLLTSAVRRHDDSDDPRLPIDDSKRIYSPARGLATLERSVHAALAIVPARLGDLLDRLCPDCLAELRGEPWFRGELELPCESARKDMTDLAELFANACQAAGELAWQVRSVVVCPARFNALADAAESKGAVLANALGELLRWNLAALAGDEALTVFVDKHGGRNAYAAQLQHGLPGSLPLARQESSARSVYDVRGLSRGLVLTFQPRAEEDHFCVALASMMSKYLREVLMREFNGFWAGHVPGLKPTAGYPGDSARFLADIRPALDRLGLSEDSVWRRR